MAETVADLLLKRLAQWHVRRIYGCPGDGIRGVSGALARQDQIEFIQARHEELAAFMACAHAKFTGEAGVCLATSGPGAIHLLGGLYDAKLDHQPVVAIIGQQTRFAPGSDYQQEIDLLSLFKDVAHEYVHLATAPEQVLHLIDRALRIAYEQRTVTCVIVPDELQDKEMPDAQHKHGVAHSGTGMVGHSILPTVDGLRQAAKILNYGKKVAILAGAGALHATEDLIDVADALGAGIAKALLGKAAVPDDLPYVTGTLGALGTKPSFDMINECDVLLMVGSTFPYTEFLPPPSQARGVQIDIDGKMVSLRYPMECNLIGDAKQTLHALYPLLDRKTDRSWRAQIEQNVQRWRDLMERRAMDAASPLNPHRVFRELSARLPANCILACDAGTAATWYALALELKRGMMASLSGGLAAVGCGVPYALGAKCAHADRPVIAFAGDGAMRVNGMNGLMMVAEQWRGWSNPTLIVAILHHCGATRDAGFKPAPLSDFTYADFARTLGLHGLRIERAEHVGPAWEQALAMDRPCVLEMMTDAPAPLLPSQATRAQAKSYFDALERGEPDAQAVRAAMAASQTSA